MRSPLLLLALAIHLAMAGSYAWRTPAFEGPDENSHYEYAWHIANAGELPITQALATEHGLSQVEGCVLAHHPPLYYALVASLLTQFDVDDTVFGPLSNPTQTDPRHPGHCMHWLHRESPPSLLVWLRMLSVALGALSLLCIYAFTRTVCPRHPAVAGVAALVVACLPMWSFLHGVLNSDSLALLLCSATMLLSARLLCGAALDNRRAVLLGVLLGSAWLTKTTTLFLGVIALAVGAALVQRARRDGSARAVFVKLLLAGGIALALASWMWIRNAGLYGDPLAMSAHDASFNAYPPLVRWKYLLGPLYTGDLAVPLPIYYVPTVFTSLLGRFGWFTCPPATTAIVFGSVVALVALLGLGRAAFDRERTYLPRPLWLLLLTALLVFAGTTYFNAKVAQPQGRLLFPAIAPAAALFAAGLARATTWLPRRQWLLAAFPLAGALAFFVTFAPSFDPALAPAPADHRELVGDIVTTRDESISWQVSFDDLTLAAPPLLRWSDNGAPAGTKYTLYAFDDDGRVWLATHEWSKGTLAIEGGELRVPDAAWSFVPTGRTVYFRLRRLPTSADDDPGELPATPPLRFTRS